MKSIGKMMLHLMITCMIFGMANIYSLIGMVGKLWLIPVLLFGFFIINIVPFVFNMGLQTARLRICGNGCELLCLFLLSVAVSVVYSVMGCAGCFPAGSVMENSKMWLVNTLIVFIVEAIVFWNGMIRIYI